MLHKIEYWRTDGRRADHFNDIEFFGHNFCDVKNSYSFDHDGKCDQIGRLLKVLSGNLFSNSSSNSSLWGYYENLASYTKTVVATFGATFGKVWATFCFNIWSH